MPGFLVPFDDHLHAGPDEGPTLDETAPNRTSPTVRGQARSTRPAPEGQHMPDQIPRTDVATATTIAIARLEERMVAHADRMASQTDRFSEKLDDLCKSIHETHERTEARLQDLSLRVASLENHRSKAIGFGAALAATGGLGGGIIANIFGS